MGDIFGSNLSLPCAVQEMNGGRDRAKRDSA